MILQVQIDRRIHSPHCDPIVFGAFTQIHGPSSQKCTCFFLPRHYKRTEKNGQLFDYRRLRKIAQC